MSDMFEMLKILDILDILVIFDTCNLHVEIVFDTFYVLDINYTVYLLEPVIQLKTKLYNQLLNRLL